MALKAALQNLEGLDETTAKLYRQEGEIFVLDVETSMGWGNENIEGLKTTVGKLRKESGEFASRLKAYDGIDPATTRDALKRLEELSAIDPEKEADRLAEVKAQAKITQIAAMHQKELSAEREKNSKLQTGYVRLGVDAVIDAALSGLEVKGNRILAAARDDLKTSLRRNIHHTFDSATGELKVSVVDTEGNPRVKNTAGDLMGIEDFVAELPTAKAHFFEPRNQQGAGANGKGGGMPTAPAGLKKRSEMTASEKGAYISKHGQPAYLGLPQ